MNDDVAQDEDEETRCVPLEDGGDFVFVPSMHPLLHLQRSVRMTVLDHLGEHLLVMGLYDVVADMPFSDVTAQCIAVPFQEHASVMRIAGNVRKAATPESAPELIVSSSPINLTASAALASASTCRQVCAELASADCRCVGNVDATTPHSVVYQVDDVGALSGNEKWFTSVDDAVHFTHFSLFDRAIAVASGRYKRVRFELAERGAIGGHWQQSLLLEAIRASTAGERQADAVINVRVSARGKRQPDLTISMHPLSGRRTHGQLRSCELNAANVNRTCSFSVLSWHDHAIDIQNNGDAAVTGNLWLSTTEHTLKAHRGEFVPVVVFPAQRTWSAHHLHALSLCSLGQLAVTFGCGLAFVVLMLALLRLCCRRCRTRQAEKQMPILISVPVRDDDEDSSADQGSAPSVIEDSGADQTRS